MEGKYPGVGKESEIPLGTPLNPQMTVSSAFDHFSGSNMGDSVDEHITVEEGNEYLAEKEISQVFNNS
ncbi:hypothetical protein [Bacillus pinisoli]|uniref:hypothetical protein n=1 Tax=Bacillus pinisoli TaxID=2901866 RepID=UPI001FF51346|nr:hypothetical protein [Bacillus pinisoli]